jgi:hypothetical protein
MESRGTGGLGPGDEVSGGSGAAVVCADVETARAALEAGDNVVLIDGDADRLGLAAGRLRGASGRLSVFVGDPSQSAVWLAAATMAAEQYRSEVRVERPPAAP